MRHWTRGEKIGCWSMVVGTVTCLAVLSTLPPFRGPLLRLFPETESQQTSQDGQDGHTRSQVEVLEQERKLLDEQTQAMREEARHLYEERARTRQGIDSPVETM